MIQATILDRKQCLQYLAQRHYAIDDAITGIYEIHGMTTGEPQDSIKLLEVNSETLETGLMPISFGPSGIIPFPVTILEITPEEFSRLNTQEQYRLPTRWTVSETAIPKDSSLLDAEGLPNAQ
ncbi:hypothetical protein [Lacunimicrobium album]